MKPQFRHLRAEAVPPAKCRTQPGAVEIREAFGVRRRVAAFLRRDPPSPSYGAAGMSRRAKARTCPRTPISFHEPLEAHASRFQLPLSLLAFTLVEILVTVALMSFIILGLLMMFSQTQRAFMSSMTQVDVLEGGRDVTDMIVNDVVNMTPSQLPNTLNFYADTNELFPNPLVQGLPGSTQVRSNLMQKFFFLTKNNVTWNAIGYQVMPDDANGLVGTLYRFSTTNMGPYASSSLTFYLTNLSYANYNFSNLWAWGFNTNANKLADGVVHFRVRVFATNGFPLTVPEGFNSQAGTAGLWPAYFKVSGVPLFSGHLPPTNQIPNAYAISHWPAFWPTEPMGYKFWSNAMPAEIEIELGVLESKLLKTYQGLGNNYAIQAAYLSNHAANVHLFRQRIHLANVDPKAY
jgi:hypothetical protein